MNDVEFANFTYVEVCGIWSKHQIERKESMFIFSHAYASCRARVEWLSRMPKSYGFCILEVQFGKIVLRSNLIGAACPSGVSRSEK